MPTFATTEPISVTIQLDIGDVRIIAGERADTVVEVEPTSGSRDADIRAAEQTRVTYADGKLLVKAPRQRTLFGRGGSVDVLVALPEGSHVHGTTAMASFTCEGRLGECTVKTSYGDIRLDQAGPVRLDTSYGGVTVDRTVGRTEVTSGSGNIRIRAVDGPAVIQNSNGDTTVGEAAGDLRATTGNGTITVDRAHAAVEARTAHGDVRIGEVARGTAVLQTGYGQLEVGIREGTAAWLDVNAGMGHVRNTLGYADGPGQSDETVEVHARTSYGDIVIRRA